MPPPPGTAGLAAGGDPGLYGGPAGDTDEFLRRRVAAAHAGQPAAAAAALAEYGAVLGGGLLERAPGPVSESVARLGLSEAEFHAEFRRDAALMTGLPPDAAPGR